MNKVHKRPYLRDLTVVKIFGIPIHPMLFHVFFAISFIFDNQKQIICRRCFLKVALLMIYSLKNKNLVLLLGEIIIFFIALYIATYYGSKLKMIRNITDISSWS